MAINFSPVAVGNQAVLGDQSSWGKQLGTSYWWEYQHLLLLIERIMASVLALWHWEMLSPCSPAALGLAPGQDVQTLGKGLEQPCGDCTPAMLEPEEPVLEAQQRSLHMQSHWLCPSTLGALEPFLSKRCKFTEYSQEKIWSNLKGAKGQWARKA